MTYFDFGINITTLKSSGHEETLCPKCSHKRKKKTEKCLMVYFDTESWFCHHCHWYGRLKESKNETYKMEYKLPQKPNITKLTDKALEWFLSRGINQEVLLKNKIASTPDGKGIIFPYFRNDELVNYKTRLLDEKKFFQAKDAEPILYNYNRVKGQKFIVCVEGEIDGLSWEVSGIDYHTSVNQGAPNENDINVEKKLECITNCFEIFEEAEIVYIGVDMDANGQRLQKELIRRIGAEKCRLIDYKDCKDANEYLVKYGAYELKQLLSLAKEVRVDGVFTVDDSFDSMLNGFRLGQKRGETTYVPEVDECWKWRTGEVNLWTGYQNEGKSLFLNQLSVLRAYWSGEKFAVFSPENMPMDDFYNDLIEMYIGKTSDNYYPTLQMTEAEYVEASSFINKHFFLVYPPNNFTIETIFEKAKYLIRKYGIRHLIIDPYNTVEHLMKAGEREDLYISRFMAHLKRFAVDYDIDIHLVAHQLTARKNKDDGGRYFKPDLNNIKGGGTFADKADNVLFIWRPDRAIDFKSSFVIFGSQKIKKQKLVAKPNEIECDFDFKSNRYLFNGVSPFSKIDQHRMKGTTTKELIEETINMPLVPYEQLNGQLWDETGNAIINDDIPF